MPDYDTRSKDGRGEPEAETIKEILMARDNMTEQEADALIEQAKEELQTLLAEGNTEAAYEICSDMFGLEPDYLMELI